MTPENPIILRMEKWADYKGLFRVVREQVQILSPDNALYFEASPTERHFLVYFGEGFKPEIDEFTLRLRGGRTIDMTIDAVIQEVSDNTFYEGRPVEFAIRRHPDRPYLHSGKKIPVTSCGRRKSQKPAYQMQKDPETGLMVPRRRESNPNYCLKMGHRHEDWELSGRIGDHFPNYRWVQGVPPDLLGALMPLKKDPDAEKTPEPDGYINK